MIKAERVQSAPEEVANGISHGIGLLMAIAGIPILVWSALDRGNAFAVAGALVFGIALVSLYLFSTLYHITQDRRLKQIFRALDHAAIFLLIAATYTPFLLGTLRGVWGWTLFAAVWTLAVSGVVFIVLPCFGLDRCFGGPAFLASCSPSWINFDRSRWYRLYRWHVFLRQQAYSFRSLGMASFRPGRNYLPFLCGPLVCRVSFLDSGASDRHSCSSNI